MAGPLESVLGFFAEGDPIFELEALLDDVLSHLAFDNINMKYVKKIKSKLEKYREFVKLHLENLPSFRCESPILLALTCLGNAYSGFFYSDWEKMSPEGIAEEARDILGDEFFSGGEFIPLSCAMNAYENSHPETFGKDVQWRQYSDGSFEFNFEN